MNQAATGGIDMTVTMLKTAGALAAVIGLMLVALWLLRRFGGARFGAGSAGSLIRVLDTRMLGPRRYVSVLRVGGRTLAVGVTEQNITLLAELAADDLDGKAADEPAPAGFAEALARITGGKNERNHGGRGQA